MRIKSLTVFLMIFIGIYPVKNFYPLSGYGHLLLHTNANWGIECIKISRDGTKLAAVYDKAVEFCNFSTTTAQITPLFLVHPPQCSGHDLQPISAEFSIDSRYLYVSAKGGHRLLLKMLFISI